MTSTCSLPSFHKLLFAACGTRPAFNVDLTEFLPEYKRPDEAETKAFDILAHKCLETVGREAQQYRKLESLKGRISALLDKNSIARIYLDIDTKKKGFIVYEDFNFWLDKNKTRLLTKVQWTNLLSRLKMGRSPIPMFADKMLFVDLFDLVFPLSNLGEYRVIGSTSALPDSKFKVFLGSMNQHLAKHPPFTKQSGASATESDPFQANLNQTGSMSQQIPETVGILELKYDGISDGERDKDEYEMPARGLVNTFSFYQNSAKGFSSNHLPKPKISSFGNTKMGYESESGNKHILIFEDFKIDVVKKPTAETGECMTEPYLSEKSDRANCLWGIQLPKGKDTSDCNSHQPQSPRFQSNSEKFHVDGIPKGLCLDDYDEIAETFTFLEGRQLRPRARSLLEKSAQQSIFN